MKRSAIWKAAIGIAVAGVACWNADRMYVARAEACAEILSGGKPTGDRGELEVATARARYEDCENQSLYPLTTQVGYLVGHGLVLVVVLGVSWWLTRKL